MCDLIVLSKALFTPTIAFLAVLIAYQQLKTNKEQKKVNSNRLKHELYEKRFEIYQGVRILLRNIVIKGTVTDDELVEYWASINAARFLLDDDLTAYLETFNNKAVDLQTKTEEIKIEGLNNNARKERAEIKKWFYGQIPVLNEKFLLYLRLEH